MSSVQILGTEIDRLEAEVDELEAEVERLRSALEAVAAVGIPKDTAPVGSVGLSLGTCLTIAREALSKEDE